MCPTTNAVFRDLGNLKLLFNCTALKGFMLQYSLFLFLVAYLLYPQVSLFIYAVLLCFVFKDKIRIALVKGGAY